MRKQQKQRLIRGVKVLFGIGVALAIIGVLTFVTYGRDMPLLQPKGTIAEQQYILILITVGLGFFVVIPVFILLFTIGWKYRASNKKAKYKPEWADHRGLEALWWGIPCIIIITLAIITVISTHALDPYKKLDSEVPAVKVQVVALEWKWLFIYPEKGIATVNYLNIPESTPVDFTITADAPMNSFWIPALAGQVYAMSGMSTELSIMSDKIGTYNGWSSNISGEGFADMQFKVNVVSQHDFDAWVQNAIYTPETLTKESYGQLAKKSRAEPQKTYTLIESRLYDEIITKYMTTGEKSEGH